MTKLDYCNSLTYACGVPKSTVDTLYSIARNNNIVCFRVVTQQEIAVCTGRR